MSDLSSVEKVSTPFKTTDRSLEEYQRLAHFQIDDIPKNGRVINVGSGLIQRFEKELSWVRPDIEIFSVDPGIFNTQYLIKTGDTPLTREAIRQRIQKLANKERTVVALGQALPFTANTFDLAIDVHGPSQYAKDVDAYRTYLNEVLRALKPGGKLHISHVWFGDPIPGNDESLKETVELSRKIFRELGLKAEIFTEVERIFPEYDGKKDVPDVRVGAIVTK